MSTFTLNNIPVRSETFLNREMEVSKITSLLNPRNRRHLIAICGMGGVGKSALALEVAYRSMERNEFDAYIWATARISELHKKRIRKYSNNLSNIDDLLQIIARVFGRRINHLPFHEKQDIVLQKLETSKGALIIVDNLESLDDASGAEILMFVRDQIPHPSKVIVTSRRSMHGEGEVEIALAGLSIERSFDLIQSELGYKKILKNLSRNEMSNIFNICEGSPLAIKFVIAQLGLVGLGGSNLSTVLSRLEDSKYKQNIPLLEYCFRESYVELSNNAKKVLLGMSLIDRFPTNFERIQLITGLSESQTENAIDELDFLSLIEKENRKYRVHPLTLSFSKKELEDEPDLQSELMSRLQE